LAEQNSNLINLKIKRKIRKEKGMKKIVFGLIVLVFLAMSSNAVFASWFSEEKAATPTTQKGAPSVNPAVVQNQSVNSAEAIAKQKAALNGVDWTVEVRPMNGKGKGETDMISFADDKVVSKNLQKEGFVPTNFTVRLLDDGTVIWETMQTSDKAGAAFWRGDIKDGVMRGVLSKRDKKNNGFDFVFISTGSPAKNAAEIAASKVNVTTK